MQDENVHSPENAHMGIKTIDSSTSSSSTVMPNDIGISYWQIYQWPDIFLVGWTPSGPSSSSESSVSSFSSSSLSSGFLYNSYYAREFTLSSANGCYRRTGAWENEYPVYSNDAYYLKYGGVSYPRWFLQQISSLAIHYWSDIVDDPSNLGARYTAQIGLGTGGFVDERCPSSSSETSVSSASINSSLSSISSSLSSLSSFSSASSSESSSVSSSSSSYYANLPVDLASYASNCASVFDIVNPETGADVGMMVNGFFDEEEFPMDETMISKGGLVKTAANGGKIWCNDAGKLFSMKCGMVSITIRPPEPITNGVYANLAGKEQSANSDMVLFCVNPGETHLTQPGLYAALTPYGIEFSVWSSGAATTIVDSTTNVAADTDVTLSFAWDRSNRIVVSDSRASSAILTGSLNHVGLPHEISSSDSEEWPTITAWSADHIAPSDLSSLFVFGSAASASSEEISSETEIVVNASAKMFIGDLPGGKNGLSGIPIRRIEIYKEPYGIRRTGTPLLGQLEEFPANSRSEFDVAFTATGMRWIGVSVEEPTFHPAISENVSLLDIGTGGPEKSLGVDLGAMESESYPETPINLPIGIEESKGR